MAISVPTMPKVAGPTATADFRVAFNPHVLDGVKNATGQLLLDILMVVRNAISARSKWLTGHNAASIGWLPPGGGAIKGRDPAPQGKKRANSAENASHEKAGTVFSTSGYGGILHTGTRHMNPDPYFHYGLSDALKGMGQLVEAAGAMIEADNAIRRWGENQKALRAAGRI